MSNVKAFLVGLLLGAVFSISIHLISQFAEDSSDLIEYSRECAASCERDQINRPIMINGNF